MNISNFTNTNTTYSEESAEKEPQIEEWRAVTIEECVYEKP